MDMDDDSLDVGGPAPPDLPATARGDRRRLDIDSYAVLPRRGRPGPQAGQRGDAREAANWYQETYGEQVTSSTSGALDELGFVQADGQPTAAATPVAGSAWPGAVLDTGVICYGLLVVGALVAMIRSPGLVPRYQDLFFTKSFTVVELVAFVGHSHCLLVHEGFHTLAGGGSDCVPGCRSGTGCTSSCSRPRSTAW